MESVVTVTSVVMEVRGFFTIPSPLGRRDKLHRDQGSVTPVLELLYIKK